MPSPAAWSLPLRLSAAPSDMGLLGEKANREEARRLGQKMGVLLGALSARLGSKGRRRLELSKLLQRPRPRWEKGLIQLLLGCFPLMVGSPSSHARDKPNHLPPLLHLGGRPLG